jgi:signal transduction histidine kinase
VERDTELTVAGLAHDLNNVFETLAESAELLGRDPKWARLAATIRRSVTRGSRIVESLTETARESGEVQAVLENAIQHADDFLQVTRAATVSWHREIEPGLRLPGSTAAWERVFVNLFLNAVQIKPEEAVIEIRARRQAEKLVITVADNGPGISAEILPHIFEPRFTTKRSRSRTGLGLHIVSSIVRANGGTVNAENREPRGALFTITLPLD